MVVSRALFCGVFPILVQSAANAQANSIPPAPNQRAVPSAGIETPPQSGSAPSAKSQQINLTLADAEARALKNEPRLLAEQFRAQAANKRVTESRSGYFPQAFGNITAVDANGDSAVAAGALTTSSISTRAAGGASLVQMITDFGHTSNLVQSARFQAQAAGQDEESIRQLVLMQVQEAYFAAAGRRKRPEDSTGSSRLQARHSAPIDRSCSKSTTVHS